MGDNKFEPAKIIGKQEIKQKEQPDPEAKTDATGNSPVPPPQITKTEPADQRTTDDDSFDGILDRFTREPDLWPS
jgi:hypothetical protein